jgi:DMSO/TMAO reductase YedYZ molybdopterin-dependent catalytic subunit
VQNLQRRFPQLTRREWLGHACVAAAGAAVGASAAVAQTSSQQPGAPQTLPAFTGPGSNPYWNSVGSFVTEPQKAPLLLLTDRPVQLETPRHYFDSAFTPNHAFYVRWHLDRIPTAVDLKTWRLRVEGNVTTPLELSLRQLMDKFPPESVAAVNQCSGNSRSRFQPRVPGAQWGNGAMGNALWTGVRLRDLIGAAGAKPGSVQLQFQGLERGEGPEGNGSREFRKSLDFDNPVLDECIVAYAMNNEPLPLLNGFPVRLVVPGFFATYWTKGLSFIRVLDKADDNFWMKTAYRIPDTPRGNTTPQEISAGTVKTVPIHRMPVRSFLVSPDGSAKIPAGMTVKLKGIAFSGYSRIARVEISSDNLQTWQAAELGADHGAYSFRTWEFSWKATTPGRHSVAVRATDEKGNAQPDEPVWNAGGYLWNRIERQEFAVGAAE